MVAMTIRLTARDDEALVLKPGQEPWIGRLDMSPNRHEGRFSRTRASEPRYSCDASLFTGHSYKDTSTASLTKPRRSWWISPTSNL